MPLQNLNVASATIHAQIRDDVLLEMYQYDAGYPEETPPHFHEEYQFGFSGNSTGSYFYRRAWHRVPKAGLSIIHPGERHFTKRQDFQSQPIQFHMMYIRPSTFSTFAQDVIEKLPHPPFFPAFVYPAHTAISLFQRLYNTLTTNTSTLRHEVALLDFISHIVANCNVESAYNLPFASHRVQSARDYIHDNFERDISLEQLAQVANISRFHLLRLFRQQYGFSPHMYHLQVRVNRAKLLLHQNVSLAEIAQRTGFFDQSHFGAWFKRLVGVSPGQYTKHGNNLLYL